MDTTPIQNEDKWLKLRSKNVNSTESSALFGLSPYMTELELFYTKQSGEIRTIEDNQRMKAGRALEPAIAELAADELGCSVEPFKDYIADPMARMGSSFDFLITSGDLKDWVLEIKNVDYLVYRDHWEDDEAPDHIEVQVQHQLEITGLPGAIIACLVGGNDLRLIKRERNPKMGAGIKKRIQRFWQDVADNNPPEPDFRRDADFLISLHQQAGDSVVEGDETIATLLRDYKRIKAEAKDLEELAKARKAEVMTLVGDDVGKVVCDGISLSCTMTKPTPPKIITPEMVGTEFGGHKGFRNFRVTEKKK